MPGPCAKLSAEKRNRSTGLTKVNWSSAERPARDARRRGLGRTVPVEDIDAADEPERMSDLVCCDEDKVERVRVHAVAGIEIPVEVAVERDRGVGTRVMRAKQPSTLAFAVFALTVVLLSSPSSSRKGRASPGPFGSSAVRLIRKANADPAGRLLAAA